MAELFCREVDRNNPPRVRRPCRRLQRTTLAPSPKILCELLQHRENAPFITQGRARLAPGSAHRTHRIACPGRRPASPIRSNLSFRYTHPAHLAPQHGQLLPERGILRLKSALRLEE